MCSTWVVNFVQSGGEKCDLHLIDQREWPFILPGPRTRAWREMWHEMLEFQSGEVSEERYVLALAVNCRNKKKTLYSVPPTPLSSGSVHRRTFTFPTKIQWKNLGGANRPRTRSGDAPSICQNIQGSPPRRVYSRSQLSSPTSLER